MHSITIHDLPISSDLIPTDADSSLDPQALGLSNADLIQHSTVEILPVELLIQIFCQCERGFKTALTLSHVCQRWRAVTLRVGSLWSKVDIVIDHGCTTEEFDAFISRLGTQLERTGQLPLDVFWQREGSNGQNGVIEDLIRRKGHFLRWKSLKARLGCDPQEAKSTLLPTDAFTNLEYLEIISPSHGHLMLPYEHPLIDRIDRSITSKFHTLNLRPSQILGKEMVRLYGNIMEQANMLILSKKEVITDRDLRLPANITTLEAEAKLIHVFPHIKSYRLRTCVFGSHSPINLQCLTSLTVDDILILLDRTVLLVPSLQSITFGAIVLEERAEFKCPSLESLHIQATQHLSLGAGHIRHIREAIYRPGYFLSPKHSLTIDQFIPSDIMTKFVELAPDVEYISLSFDDEECVSSVLETIGCLVEGSRSPSTQASTGLLRLVEVRVRSMREEYDAEVWVGHAAGIMERCHTGEGPPLMSVSKCKDNNHTIVLRRCDR